ncbi:hypothetical protein GCK32_013995 [Trichostrongylus colubriformis]|uniref:Amine oxidase domain-containing protein n=1 Tax=Trichostrongylus colubriformis TaxID=6319 RepID=A0AAN8FDE6_TRICO
MVPTQRQAAYVNIVARALGGNGPPPLDISEDHFWTDVCSRGSIGVLPPNVDIASLRFLRGVNEHGERVLFASAEYSNVSMGLMNGAILSGKAAGTTVARRLQDPDERDREDNEVANLVRLNDDVTKTSQHLAVWMESRRPSSSTPFPYSTSTHYPQTHPIEVITFKHFSFGNLGDVNEETGNVFENDESSMGENAGVETATEGRSFVYHTSSLNPSVEPFETSTFEHFNFGNGPPMAPFVPPPRSGTPGATASFPTTTTTARSTFTPRDPNRHTTPFQYHTSTINTPLKPAEAVPFEHFSSENVGEALSDPANDVELLTSKEDIIRRLSSEPTTRRFWTSSLQLAKQLAAVLHGLLQAMREERR